MRAAAAGIRVATVVLLFAPARAAGTQDYQRIVEGAVTGGVPGVQAVVQRGSVQWAGVGGVSSVEQRTPMTMRTRIRVASVTKMLTYALIAQLAKEGRLRLTDRAIDHLPPGRLAGIPYADLITIEQLMEHTSGVHNFNGANGADFMNDLYGDPARGKRVRTAAELIAFARKSSNAPTGKPGEKRDYSSTGYIILEMIAEHVTSQPLGELFRQRIFRPLGMSSTGLEGHDLRVADIADSYGRPNNASAANSPYDGREPVRADGLVNLSAGLTWYGAWARGAGAVASTACDLARFMNAVTTGNQTVLRSQAEEFAAVRARPAASLNWNGGSAGIQASILYAPASDIVVIVLTNGTNAGKGSLEIARELLAASQQAVPPSEDGRGCARAPQPDALRGPA